MLKKIEQDIALGTFDYGKYFPNSSMVQHFKELDAASKAESDPGLIDGTPLLRDFVDDWMRDRSVEWRHSYRESVESILNKHLLPALGDTRLGQIDRASVMALRARLASGTEREGDKARKPATVNRILGILSMICDEANLRHGIPNPLVSVKRLKVQRVDIEPFSIDEVRLLISRVRPDYSDYLAVRFFTGMRSGEANGLKWEHIDFERREIRIRETFVRGRAEYTKTDGSQREIQMSNPVYEALRRMEARTRAIGAYVFCSRNGLPIDNHNFVNRVWNPLLRHLGLKPRRPYQMRHTCATLWLGAGENPEWIARQLGHTTTEMLFRVYSRFVPNLTRRDGSAFDHMVSAALQTQPSANQYTSISSQENSHV